MLVFCVAAELLFVCEAHALLLFWRHFSTFSGSRFLRCFRSKFSSSSIVLISRHFFCIAVVFPIKWVVDVLSTNKHSSWSFSKKKESKKTKVEDREQSVSVILLCLFCGFDEAASSSSCCCYFQSWVIKICCW